MFSCLESSHCGALPFAGARAVRGLPVRAAPCPPRYVIGVHRRSEDLWDWGVPFSNDLVVFETPVFSAGECKESTASDDGGRSPAWEYGRSLVIGPGSELVR